MSVHFTLFIRSDAACGVRFTLRGLARALVDRAQSRIEDGVHTKIDRFLIPGPAGRLEAMLEWDPQATPRLATLVCHPHPVHGGTFHNKVVFRAAKASLELGLPTLRFNFRGVGHSEGQYAGGVGERDDVRAALDYLEQRVPAIPACVMGFSFGAWVGLAAGAHDPRVRALAGLGLPTSTLNFDFLRDTRKPKLIIQGTHDQYGPEAQVKTVFQSFAEPKRLHWVENADHFFTGKLAEVQAALRAFLQEILDGMPK